jgi:predicted PurR-regulated permease PerM
MPIPDAVFLRRVLIVLGVAAAAFLVWMLRFVLLLMFGATVWAILLRSLAEPLARRLRLDERLALALVIVLLIAALGLLGLFFGWRIQGQIAEAASLLPRAQAVVMGWIRQTPLGQQVLQMVQSIHPQDAVGTLMHLPGYAITVVTAVADLLIVLASGVYLALQPELYRDGLVRFAPRRMRPRLAVLFQDAEILLRKWLLGQLLAMATVGLMVGIGMWLIGAPAAAALGLFAGLAEFIPIAGPILSAVPALLLAALQGFDKVGWTLLLFFVVQHIEGDLLLPLIQRRMVRLPPAATLFALLAFGVVFGVLGIVLAAPLAVLAAVVIRRIDDAPALPKSS